TREIPRRISPAGRTGARASVRGSGAGRAPGHAGDAAARHRGPREGAQAPGDLRGDRSLRDRRGGAGGELPAGKTEPEVFRLGQGSGYLRGPANVPRGARLGKGILEATRAGDVPGDGKRSRPAESLRRAAG